jgi:hypothetical protein
LRRLIAIAGSALLALTISPAPSAEACVSCEYVPEVARSPVKAAPQKPSVKPQVRQRAAARPQQKQSVRAEPVTRRERAAPVRTKVKREEVKVAKSPKARPPKPVARNNVVPVAAPAAAVEPAPAPEPVVPAEAPAPDTADTAPEVPAAAATASQALSQTDAAAAAKDDQTEPEKTCKKYLPDAGATVSVPCE